MSDLRKRYIKKDPIEHILLRPDMYIGSISLRKREEYIMDKINEYSNEMGENTEVGLNQGSYRLLKKEINSSPAIIRIFIEALSNAVDNVERSRITNTKCTKIKVNLNRETGETSIWNDGDVVPIEMNEECNCYNHSLIFGQLLTGSNYDDKEDRLVSGKNGLGIKICNVFSSIFTVEGCDPVNKKTLVQTWTNNMRNTNGPVVRTSKLKKGYTEVRWIPDFRLFNIEKYTDDILNLYKK